MDKLIYFFFVMCATLPCLLASSGDRSLLYQTCVKNCLNINCTEDGSEFKEMSRAQQGVLDSLLLWNCRDECRYHCMWLTVDEFKKRGFSVPKFHGKWPFERFLGVQEPQAAFASLLNLASTYHMYRRIKSRYSGQNIPLTTFWQGFAMVGMNTWVWSTVFHTRDMFFTEFMDYASALMLMMAFFIAAVVRVFYKWRLLTICVCAMVFLFYVQHCCYLYTGQIDYDYNVNVNVRFGVMATILWAGWTLYQFICGWRYHSRLIAFISLSGAALGLELFDFPPILGGWDAHALWHLATAPLPYILSRFIMADLDYLQFLQDTDTKLA